MRMFGTKTRLKCRLRRVSERVGVCVRRNIWLFITNVLFSEPPFVAVVTIMSKYPLRVMHNIIWVQVQVLHAARTCYMGWAELICLISVCFFFTMGVDSCQRGELKNNICMGSGGWRGWREGRGWILENTQQHRPRNQYIESYQSMSEQNKGRICSSAQSDQTRVSYSCSSTVFCVVCFSLFLGTWR